MGRASNAKKQRRREHVKQAAAVEFYKNTPQASPFYQRLEQLLIGFASQYARQVATINGQEFPIAGMEDDALKAFQQLVWKQVKDEKAKLEVVKQDPIFQIDAWRSMFRRVLAALDRYHNMVVAECLSRGMIVSLD